VTPKRKLKVRNYWDIRWCISTFCQIVSQSEIRIDSHVTMSHFNIILSTVFLPRCRFFQIKRQVFLCITNLRWCCIASRGIFLFYLSESSEARPRDGIMVHLSYLNLPGHQKDTVQRSIRDLMDYFEPILNQNYWTAYSVDRSTVSIKHGDSSRSWFARFGIRKRQCEPKRKKISGDSDHLVSAIWIILFTCSVLSLLWFVQLDLFINFIRERHNDISKASDWQR